MEDQMIEEVFSNESKKIYLDKLFQIDPISRNYVNLMMQECPEYLKQYRFYMVKSTNRYQLTLAGLSPEGSINLYGKHQPNITNILEYILDQNNLKSFNAIRGNIDFYPAVKKYIQKRHQLMQTRTFEHYSKNIKKMSKHDNENIEIRTAKTDDFDFLYANCLNYNSEMNVNYSPISEDKINKGLIYIITKSGTRAGFIMNTMNWQGHGWLGRLYIRKECRRKKLGSAILSGIEQKLYLNGVTHINAHASIDNISSKNFLIKNSYDYIGDGFNANFGSITNTENQTSNEVVYKKENFHRSICND
jgi:GNAT superfamily N-acetyltransferase